MMNEIIEDLESPYIANEDVWETTSAMLYDVVLWMFPLHVKNLPKLQFVRN